MIDNDCTVKDSVSRVRARILWFCAPVDLGLQAYADASASDSECAVRRMLGEGYAKPQLGAANNCVRGATGL